MPKKMHDALKRSARKKGLKGKQAAAYIYGALQNYEGKVKGKKGKKNSSVARPAGK